MLGGKTPNPKPTNRSIGSKIWKLVFSENHSSNLDFDHILILIGQGETIKISIVPIPVTSYQVPGTRYGNITRGVEFECLPAPRFSFGKMTATCRYQGTRYRYLWHAG